MHKNFFEVNDLISEYLQSGKPFSCLRIDNTSGYVMHCLDRGILPSSEWYNPYALVEGGVVPASTEYGLNVVYPRTVEEMKKTDILGFVDISGDIKRDTKFLSNFPNSEKFFDFWIMDPGSLLGLSPFGHLANPWSQYLAGKKVLVLSSHANSIKQQWSKIDLIWGENRNKIAPFELVDAISTPYHPAIDDRQYPNCSDFESLVQITKNRIDQYDYDVLLTGISTQSPFYAEHAKQRGKVGIQTGGTIQLFFGLLGGRWVHGAPYAKWHSMFNEHWMYPLDIDKPQRKADIKFLESSHAYW